MGKIKRIIMNNNIKKYSKDSEEYLENLDLVQMSRKLLEAVIMSTEIMDNKEKRMTWQGLKEAKLVLGYLNAANNQVRTRMQWFKMTNLEKKIESVKAKNVKRLIDDTV